MNSISVWAFYNNLHVYCNSSLGILRECKASQGYGPGGMVSETHQCYAPIHSMWLCVLRCVNYMRSVRWNTTVCRPVYHGVPENSSTKKSGHTRCSLFCCAYERLFMVRICPSVMSGRDTWLFRIWSAAGVFCFHIPFLQAMCRRWVYMDLWWHTALQQFR